ncbi:MAG: STAS domain-containing protein [Peptostreptococcaceae bacterium]
MSINISSKLNSKENFWEITLEGELDVSTAENLKDQLHKIVDENMLDVKINLTNLEYIDSTGLGVMIGVLKKLRANNKEIYILNPRDNVNKIFKITGLDKIFKMEA